MNQDFPLLSSFLFFFSINWGYFFNRFLVFFLFPLIKTKKGGLAWESRFWNFA